jgi:hypothetical protein
MTAHEFTLNSMWIAKLCEHRGLDCLDYRRLAALASWPPNVARIWAATRWRKSVQSQIGVSLGRLTA